MSREEQLEARVLQLEAMVESLSGQIQSLNAQGLATMPAGTAALDTGTPAEVLAPSATGGPAAPGQSLPPIPPPSARFNSPATLDSIAANVKFGPGFEIRTDDDEYVFQFHNLTQLDYRGYLQGGQNPVHNTFALPRQWFMFSGRLSKPFGYFVSLANGFDNVTALDVFGDFDVDPRFRLRFGRFKTPFTYEFLVEPPQAMMSLERSLFFNNFGLNRDLGIMAFGRLFDGQLDYAAGIFNGNRNGYVAQQDAKYVSSFVNYRPFNDRKDSPLENFNVGGSVYAGRASHVPTPTVYRTIVPMTGNAVAGVPFLALNSDVQSQGFEAYWDLHVAWYYRQLALLAEWGSGQTQFATTANLNARAMTPVQSWYIQGGYLLTGETRSSLGLVKPNHPFSLKPGEIGLGAWELVGRYDYMDISSSIFTNGFADPNLWANRLWMTDIGLNWHLTQYLKVYIDWNHAEFNRPVEYTATPVVRKQLTSDMFWLRFQLYF